MRLTALLQERVHVDTLQTLRRRDRAVLVRQKQRLEINNLLAQLLHLAGQRVVLRRIDLYLVLQVLEPLLLALATLERGDTAAQVSDLAEKDALA